MINKKDIPKALNVELIWEWIKAAYEDGYQDGFDEGFDEGASEV